MVINSIGDAGFNGGLVYCYLLSFWVLWLRCLRVLLIWLVDLAT